MDIILREHIDNLGRRGDVVKVARGYARNYLLPRKLALPVTENNRRQIERERKLAEVREAADKQTAEAFAARLGSAECVIARRVGEQDTLYGSVTAADIAESLAAQQIDVDKRKIQLGEPIRELGEFSIPVKVHREVTAQVALKVIKEVVDE
ncbi:MAG: 50S ribosomal protein L9 [Acidobacteriota bacterium]|nr:50S ribosomal protein L9 [Acidobacteriota bacterium]MEC9301589.1 50S ribosomal protein L9 [Acidobacteriota bacterium]MED5377384.1 50S ribosomal protein L9 [Acidobacteriota bacterium]|tara:strand:- start:863 stop:1318 length:456 start_codon:yes stop_codon:yes gene_type:complete